VQKLGGPSRFTVTTGEGAAPAAQRAPRPAGGLRDEALKHPLVEKAMELFKADVRSVLDLGQK
jgi:DNA polymerase III subunit gamma/tau